MERSRRIEELDTADYKIRIPKPYGGFGEGYLRNTIRLIYTPLLPSKLFVQSYPGNSVQVSGRAWLVTLVPWKRFQRSS